MKKLLYLCLILAVAFGWSWHRFAEDRHFPDLSSDPLLSDDKLEVVVDLKTPPGNVAVSETGRVFLTLHPEASPLMNVVEVKDGIVRPFPDMSWQPSGSNPLRFQEVLSIRIDQHNRLWVLDTGIHGFAEPRILAFDLTTAEMVYQYDFDKNTFGIGSHANDFQVTRDGKTIFISDASIFGKSPALVVLDVEAKRARRVLENDMSVLAGGYEAVVQGRAMTVAGVFTIDPGVDGIALSRDQQYLYYASVSGDNLYRLPVSSLMDETLTPSQLAAAVEPYVRKTMTDGMTTDNQGNVYLSDIENSAIIQVTPDRKLITLVKSDRLRWPDGFSFGADGYLYVTASALHQVIGKLRSEIKEKGPYQVFRIATEQSATAGH